MPRLFSRAALVVMFLLALLASNAGAARPVVNDHEHFTSDPYADRWCGINGTSIDTVVVHYLEAASGASIETVNVTTLFTATVSGKTMEVRSTGARKSGAPIDNGDGSVSFVGTNTGLSPMFKLPNGPPIVIDVGLVEFLITVDAATGDFISFEVLKETGQRPPGCDAIVAALT